MMRGASRQIIALHQGEGGAWHFKRGIAGCGAQQGAGKGAFAGTKWPIEQHRIAGAQQWRKPRRQRFRRRQIG